MNALIESFLFFPLFLVFFVFFFISFSVNVFIWQIKPLYTYTQKKLFAITYFVLHSFPHLYPNQPEMQQNIFLTSFHLSGGICVDFRNDTRLTTFEKVYLLKSLDCCTTLRLFHNLNNSNSHQSFILCRYLHAEIKRSYNHCFTVLTAFSKCEKQELLKIIYTGHST